MRAEPWILSHEKDKKNKRVWVREAGRAPVIRRECGCARQDSPVATVGKGGGLGFRL